MSLRLVALFLAGTALMSADSLDSPAAGRFARLALACVHREYPTKIAHVLNSPSDVKSARELTPAFYGCFDWHSSVHGHWLLARLARLFPDAEFTPDARAALAQSLTAANLQRESEYLKGENRASFERPYGLAWLLQLASELHEWNDPAAQAWAAAMNPLETAVVARVESWLRKLSHPVRSGEHSQTAFALGLMLDYARANHAPEFAALLEAKIRDFYLPDRNCPLSYEPSGEDFLSPCLAEADAVRRVLPPERFAAWLTQFLPSLSITPEVVTDPTDGKLAHLDGLNLSRAWMLNGIASALPAADPRLNAIRATAQAHAHSGLASVTGAHYEGGHWLGSFAVYLLTARSTFDAGQSNPRSASAPPASR